MRIKKNVDSYLSLDSMKGSGPKKCSLTFEIGVKGAKIYLDGILVKKGKTQQVKYGEHSLSVIADGYDTWTRTLIVNSPEATIALDISDSKEGSTKSSGASSSGTGGSTASGTTGNSSATSSSNDNSSSASGSDRSSGNDTDSDSSSKSAKGKAEENYLSTLADSIVNSVSGSSD